MGKYAAVLEGFGRLEGIKEAFILTETGGKIESLHDSEMSSRPPLAGSEEKELFGLTLSALSGARHASAAFGRGSAGQNYIEYKAFNITFDTLSNDRILVVTAASGTNLGRIRYEMKQSKKKFEEIG